ncbi:hypothetical protein AKJ66_01500 [candidate division MSBL1 archaeon SCGC-AAA259E22]|uniref:CAAX prenyl protease 2/Lysostaphin resistance protein A-like domain-containing protein n=1 Tax=candidate division MSBL1 archaeon SCGC-AAA259E22 TaxID=1698265 RepID=A0A133UHM0_9EURY|nr:hypothetical protein AKJ66_01500 [candidate division MSBL1 archaeon SCGC-AAA259E22]
MDTIFIVLISIVFVSLIALADFLENSDFGSGSHHSSGGVKLFTPQNWFGPAPEGSWTYKTTGEASEVTTYIGIISFLLAAWLATNVPAARFAGLSYMGFITFWALCWVAEIIRPKLAWVAFIDVGSLKKWPSGLAIGGVLGSVLFLFASFQKLQLVNLSMLEGVSPVLVFATTVVLAPLAETGFFNALILPTTVEDFGIVPGLVFTCALFAGFHMFAYGGGTFALMIAAVFMLTTGVLTLARRAFIGAMVAHSVFNLLAFLAWTGMLGGLLPLANLFTTVPARVFLLVVVTTVILAVFVGETR